MRKILRAARSKHYWLYTTVLLLCVMWIFLLFWTKKNSEKQHAYYALNSAVMDIQLHTSNFHLWFEEFLAGDHSIDIDKVWQDHKNSLILIDAVLNGGYTEHGPITEPLTNAGLRSRLMDIRAALIQFGELAVHRMENPDTAGIGSKMDHKFDIMFNNILTKISAIVDEMNVNSENDQLQAKQYFLTIGTVWTVILTIAVLGLRKRDRQRWIAEEALLLANEQLQNQTMRLTELREQLEKQVKCRTEELTSVNESLWIEIRERKQKEAALQESKERLRYLSRELLTTQDDERKRVSAELHDELGQSLTLLKLQLRSVKKQLREDQGMIKEECDNILQFINGVIDNVRRLATDLSPYILEDFGLTGALRRLIKDCVCRYEVETLVDIMEIDDFVSPKAAIHLYRILQEALTNTMKHSGAKNVAIVIRSDGERIFFSYEDNGVGFDTENGENGAKKHNSRKGLGLMSMDERVKMLGGSLELSSSLANGTRIAFTIPIETGQKQYRWR